MSLAKALVQVVQWMLKTRGISLCRCAPGLVQGAWPRTRVCAGPPVLQTVSLCRPLVLGEAAGASMLFCTSCGASVQQSHRPGKGLAGPL